MTKEQSRYRGLLAGLAVVAASSSGNAGAMVLKVDQEWLQHDSSQELLSQLTQNGIIDFHEERLEITLKVPPLEFMESAGILQKSLSFEEESSACSRTEEFCVRN